MDVKNWVDIDNLGQGVEAAPLKQLSRVQAAVLLSHCVQVLDTAALHGPEVRLRPGQAVKLARTQLALHKLGYLLETPLHPSKDEEHQTPQGMPGVA